MALVSQWIQFCIATPFQVAIASALDTAENPYEGFPTFYDYLIDQYTGKKQRLSDGLFSATMLPVQPEGMCDRVCAGWLSLHPHVWSVLGRHVFYHGRHEQLGGASEVLGRVDRCMPTNDTVCFALSCFRAQQLCTHGAHHRDWALARCLTIEAGVTAIPPSAFVTPASKPLWGNFLRFAFCKKDESIAEASQNLIDWVGRP